MYSILVKEFGSSNINKPGFSYLMFPSRLESNLRHPFNLHIPVNTYIIKNHTYSISSRTINSNECRSFSILIIINKFLKSHPSTLIIFRKVLCFLYIVMSILNNNCTESRVVTFLCLSCLIISDNIVVSSMWWRSLCSL